MKIISWNINSLRLRLPLLQKLTNLASPDIICLQETKVCDADFPLAEVKNMGFNFVEFSGEKSYNGVAILSKIPLKNVQKIDIENYVQKRHISTIIETAIGAVEIHNFYVPAGGDIPDATINDKFNHKLKFIDWMSDFFSTQKNKKIIILGDMNIAPLENDVWSHKQLLKIVSHTPIEVEKMLKLQQSLNFTDSHRHFTNSTKKLYSWWSYRAKDPLGADKGRRLDHIWVTPNLTNHLKEALIYRDFRCANQPSDHVPILTKFNFDDKI